MNFNRLQLFENMFCIALRLVQKKTRIGYEKGNKGNKYPPETFASIETEILKNFMENKQHIHFDNICSSSYSLV